MIGIVDAFSPSYAQARKKFLEGAAAAGLPIESHAHPLKGVMVKTLPWTWCATGRAMRPSCSS